MGSDGVGPRSAAMCLGKTTFRSRLETFTNDGRYIGLKREERDMMGGILAHYMNVKQLWKVELVKRKEWLGKRMEPLPPMELI